MARPALVVLGALVWAGCGTSDRTRERPDPNVLEGDEIERRDLARVEDMLRGQIAGVDVRQSEGGLIVRIRGAADFGYSGGDPLFVIDGLPLAQGMRGVLVGVNPRDVESIRVLKNAADTAIYGSRGANGVILITTKRPPAPPDDGDAAPEDGDG